jgi:hypothetical protein
VVVVVVGGERGMGMQMGCRDDEEEGMPMGLS